MMMYAQGHLLKPSPLGGGRWQQIFDLLTDEGMKVVCPEDVIRQRYTRVDNTFMYNYLRMNIVLLVIFNSVKNQGYPI